MINFDLVFIFFTKLIRELKKSAIYDKILYYLKYAKNY